MRPRLEAALAAIGHNMSLQDVAALLLRYPASTKQPCFNPDCAHVCEWREGAGRPKLFHSDACRVAYVRKRQGLLSEIQALEDVLGAPGPSYVRRSVEVAVAQRRWALARYPDVGRSRSASAGLAQAPTE
jgi:hypothetical protein